MTVETEKCEKCAVEVEKGALIRDAFDASQLRCAACSAPDPKPRKPRKRKEKAVIMAATATIEMIVTQREQEDTPPLDLAQLRKDAEIWAKECGLGPVTIDGPDREDFPRHGFGYNFHVQETSGKKRMATARYTKHGARNYWSMDSLVTG